MEGDGHVEDLVKTTRRISIHTLRMEGDVGLARFHPDVGHFNPHPPHGG